MSTSFQHRAWVRRTAFTAVLALIAQTANTPLVLAQMKPNVIRLAAVYTPAGAPVPSGNLYFASVNADALASGADVTFEGYVQSAANGSSIPFRTYVPGGAIRSISFSPQVPTAASPMASYSVLQDGQPTPYVLKLATYVDELKANTLVHSGIVVNTQTGEQMTLTALNDPIPVGIIIGGAIVLVLCGTGIITDLVNSCTSQAIKACGDRGVKKVNVKINFWSLLTGCRSDCEYECNPPKTKGADQQAAH